MISDNLLKKHEENQEQQLKALDFLNIGKKSPNSTSVKTKKGKGRIELKVPEEVEEKWKAFFAEHGCSMTKGITYAVGYLMNMVEKRTVALSFEGISNL